MPANAPHWTTSEYGTCRAESIPRITMVEESISNHVIFIVILGESDNKFVAIIKPFGISPEVNVVVVVIVLVCQK